jgi:hypothetical protein
MVLAAPPEAVKCEVSPKSVTAELRRKPFSGIDGRGDLIFGGSSLAHTRRREDESSLIAVKAGNAATLHVGI